jgi:hypothetical protein
MEMSSLHLLIPHPLKMMIMREEEAWFISIRLLCTGALRWIVRQYLRLKPKDILAKLIMVNLFRKLFLLMEYALLFLLPVPETYFIPYSCLL